MAKLVFILIIGITILNYLLNRILEFLNISRCSTTLPKELEGIYSSRRYFKSSGVPKREQGAKNDETW